MYVLFVLAIVAAVFWLLAASGERFVPGFAQLLSDTRVQRSPIAFFTGRSYLQGRFNGRDVVIRLQLKRSRYGQGYLVVAMKTSGDGTLDYDGIDARAKDEEARRALFTIAKHDLVVSVEEGWLKALWQPQGFVIVPGRFLPEKWREVLQAMSTIAGRCVSPGSAAGV